MSPNRTLLLRLRREIENELSSLKQLESEHLALPVDAESGLEMRGRASILHDFYTGAERVFVRIAEELDGGIPRSEQWHRQLLTDMTLDIPHVRPPVISAELEARLLEFLRFRHLFRNLYGFVLDPQRIAALERGLAPCMSRFQSEVHSFLDWLTEGL